MIDDPNEAHGLGAIDSPPDDRDFPMSLLYALTETELAAAPASFLVPAPHPPILNQHATPMCVAYSSSTLKAYEDLRDTGPADLDEPTFFYAIGGTANGAVIRNALARMRSTGYPVVSLGQESRHRIDSYYAVPLTKAELQSAIATFGPVLIGTPWYHSWFHPTSGVLPSPDYPVGGHALVAIGWDSRGLRLRNSWGTAWGIDGDAFLPWSMLPSLREAWKAIDHRDVPPPGYRFRIHGVTEVYRRPETAPISRLRSGSGPCRKADVDGHTWYQIVKSGSPVNGRWLHAGDRFTVTPIALDGGDVPGGTEP